MIIRAKNLPKILLIHNDSNHAHIGCMYGGMLRAKSVWIRGTWRCSNLSKNAAGPTFGLERLQSSSIEGDDTDQGNVRNEKKKNRTDSKGNVVARYHAKDVPLGSILDITSHKRHIDILIVNGGMEELTISTESEEPVGAKVSIRKSGDDIAGIRAGTSIYGVQVSTESEGLTREANGRIIAEIPPRYFGIHIKTSGNIMIQAGMKEAQLISIEADGDIHCQGALSAEATRLVSHGAGSIQASTIMSNRCSIATKSRGIEKSCGTVSIGRSSCLELSVDAGKSIFDIDSLLCSNARVRAGTIRAKNLNTLDGEAYFDISPSQDNKKVTVGGMDGKVSIQVLPSIDDDAHEDDNGIEVDMQLNKNAKSLIVHGSSPISTTLHANEVLDVMIKSGEEFVTYNEPGNTNSCSVILPPQSSIVLNRRSWFEAFRQSSGYDDTTHAPKEL